MSSSSRKVRFARREATAAEFGPSRNLAMKYLRHAGLLAALLAFFSLSAMAQQRYILEASAQNAPGLISRYGLTLIRTIADEDTADVVYSVSAPGTSPSPSLIALISSDPQVEEFEVDDVVDTPEADPGSVAAASLQAVTAEAANTSTTTFYSSQVRTIYVTQPAADTVNIVEAHGVTPGTGIVAVIDDGVDPTHPALKNVIVPGYDFVHGVAGTPSELADVSPTASSALSKSATVAAGSKTATATLNQSTVAILDQSTVAILDGSGSVPGDFGHGTMVSGLIHLVAPNAKIMPIKSFSSNGTGNLSDILSGIYYAADHGATVINMSFSQTISSPSLATAIAYAVSKGAICVASAGNDGKPEVVYPAGLPSVVGVGSTNNDGIPSSFSNYGVPSVFMSAPGEALITTYPGNNYAAVWGTSFSSALVSGAVAILGGVVPGIAYPQASTSLMHGEPVTPTMGYSLLDVMAAIDFVNPSSGGN